MNTAAECAREPEVVRAVALRGCDGLSDELRSHAEACEVCGDVLFLATTLRADVDDTMSDVQLPAAGQLWWRAALRAHAEATEAAGRPMVWLQGIAAACAAGVMAAVLTLAWPSISEAVVAVSALPATFSPDVSLLVDALRPILPAALAILACLVFTPIVVYLALSDE